MWPQTLPIHSPFFYRFGDMSEKKRLLSAPLITTLALGVGVGLGIWAAQDTMIGLRPTQEYASVTAADTGEAYDDPALTRLRQGVQASPNDSRAYLALADGLQERIAKGEIPKQAGMLELVDVLSRALQVNPDDWSAVLMLADVAFESRVFPKSKELYERYLEVYPDDFETKARYASTITFLGEVDRAISILQEVVEKRPEDFRAHAFLAIALAQKGDLEQSLRVGESAIAKAPSDEARARFQDFLDSVNERGSSVGEADVPTSSPSSALSQEESLPVIVQAVRQNPVAGPKFVSFESKDEILVLRFRDFPMQAMPPVAKDKFFGSLRNVAKAGEFRVIHFVDHSSSTVMEKLEL